MLYLAFDHAGFQLKNKITSFLEEADIQFEDVGSHTYDLRDDYPDYIIPAAQK